MVQPQSEGRTRFAREGGWLGRRRHYRCRRCDKDFVHDGNTLPEDLRICPVRLLLPDIKAKYLASLEARKNNTEGGDNVLA